MQTNEINSLIQPLDFLIHQAIIKAVKSVTSRCHILGNNPQEPDFIASLRIEFTPDLFNILKSAFPKSRFTLTGIYCHQKPIVDIGLM